LLAQSSIAAVATRNSSLQIARQQLAETQVRVPISTATLPSHVSSAEYVITKRAVAEGTFVRVGTELFRLAIDDVLKLRVAVPERIASRVAVGQSAKIENAAATESFAGTVTLVNPSVDSSTRTFQVEIQIMNSEHRLKPGGFAKATVRTALNPRAATVPIAAVTSVSSQSRVFMVDHELVEETPVRLGAQTTDWVEVLEPPLLEGSVVVVSGHSALVNGTAVAVRDGAVALPQVMGSTKQRTEYHEAVHHRVLQASGETR
jgi:RND family efflux transporter MFP subunit